MNRLVSALDDIWCRLDFQRAATARPAPRQRTVAQVSQSFVQQHTTRAGLLDPSFSGTVELAKNFMSLSLWEDDHRHRRRQ